MAKKSITMESISSQHQQEEDQILDVVFIDDKKQETDLSYWEFINQSDADSSDTESLLSLEDGFVSWYALTPPSSSSPPKSPSINREIEAQVVILDQDLVGDVGSVDDHHIHCCGYNQPQVRPPMIHNDDDGDHRDEKDDEYDNDEEEDGYGYGYGLDDELVPWNVTGKLGRQRMRKLGKRVFSKMGNSKRKPYLFLKPGAVHGKHGLGLKA